MNTFKLHRRFEVCRLDFQNESIPTFDAEREELTFGEGHILMEDALMHLKDFHFLSSGSAEEAVKLKSLGVNVHPNTLPGRFSKGKLFLDFVPWRGKVSV